MEEIGGYFGLEQLVNNEFYKSLIRLNTARNALLYILEAKNIKKIYIPFYLCDSVSNTLGKLGYDFDYYHINEDFLPKINTVLKEKEYIYIVNYYGQIKNETILKLKEIYGNIILDNTQAFFQLPIEGIDTIYSCRKFFGVPDGAYLSTNIKLEKELELDISKDRMEHILGRFESKASDYYSLFLKNDKDFEHQKLKYMSKLTRNLLGAIDYEKVCQIRNENYSFLENKLKHKNILNLNRVNGPFAYPLYIESDLEIRKELANRKIYIATLWPNVLNDMNKDSLEYRYAKNILPLPCDQRYKIEDMKRLVDLILSI